MGRRKRRIQSRAVSMGKAVSICFKCKSEGHIARDCNQERRWIPVGINKSCPETEKHSDDGCLRPENLVSSSLIVQGKRLVRYDSRPVKDMYISAWTRESGTENSVQRRKGQKRKPKANKTGNARSSFNVKSAAGLSSQLTLPMDEYLKSAAGPSSQLTLPMDECLKSAAGPSSQLTLTMDEYLKSAAGPSSQLTLPMDEYLNSDAGPSSQLTLPMDEYLKSDARSSSSEKIEDEDAVEFQNIVEELDEYLKSVADKPLNKDEDSTSAWPAGWGLTCETDPYLFTSYFRTIHPPFFDVWVEEHRKKAIKVCGKNCVAENCRCYGFETCEYVHGADVPCPPCVLQMEQPQVGFETLTTKGGPIEVSLSNVSELYVVSYSTFSLAGQSCNIIISVKKDWPYYFPGPDAMWSYMSFQLARWAFENQGFENEAIIDIYERLEESTLDLFMDGDDLEAEALIDTPIEKLSPAYNVVFVASYGGRLKIATGQQADAVVDVIGDNRLGCGTLYDVMCYNQPLSKITIQEGHLCENDVIMMVPKWIQREKRVAIAGKHDDVETMARLLVKDEETNKAARLENDDKTTFKSQVWVARIRNP